jgi:hypothetical protein
MKSKEFTRLEKELNRSIKWIRKIFYLFSFDARDHEIELNEEEEIKEETKES